MSDYALYILMRHDLKSMGPGRAAAQASHAANAFIHKYGKRKDVQSWQKQTKQGFGTAIVLSVCSQTLHDAINVARSWYKTPCDTVVDPEYSMTISTEMLYLIDQSRINRTSSRYINIDGPGEYLMIREEITCGYIFGDREKLKDLLDKFPLYPQKYE
jgi:peptidyl-tRNA hydrolase